MSKFHNTILSQLFGFIKKRLIVYPSNYSISVKTDKYIYIYIHNILYLISLQLIKL